MVRAHLEAPGDSLFALLDAARDPGVLAVLRESDQPYQSLYEGTQADDLAEYGPYLVSLDGGGQFLERLIAAGWGRSWGVYLASRADFATVRHHLRRYLTVEIPGASTALFRFYDPRVLRLFLASWTPEERSCFFGPVARFALEDAEGSVTPRQYGPDGPEDQQPDGPR